MTEYFRNIGREKYYKTNKPKNYADFEYRAVGPAQKTTYGIVTEHPVAEISGTHTYAQYVPTFENERKFGEPSDFDQTGVTGLSDEYLRHKNIKLHGTSYERDLTNEESDALSALNLIRGNEEPDGHRNMLWAVNQFDTNPHLAPTQLFEESKPAKTHISRMFADRSMNTQAMTLAGMAFRDHGNAPIEADTSLSIHSSKLVKGALKKGLPVVTTEENPDAEVSNDITDQSHWVFPSDVEEYRDFMKKVPDSDVKATRADMRSMLRDARPKRNPKPVTAKGLSDQFLPGMEGFV